MLIEFMGATSRTEDDGSRTWEPRGPVSINPSHVVAAYDHSIVVPGNIIRVMESYDEIMKKLKPDDDCLVYEAGCGDDFTGWRFATDGKLRGTHTAQEDQAEV